MRHRWFSLVLLGAASAFAQIDGDPLYVKQAETNGASFLAWRPFYSHTVEDAERWRKDYLWPLYTQKGFKEETYGRILFFGYSTDFGDERTGRDRTWILPFWYSGTSAQGEDYRAVFPFGGTIREFLGRDSISFALWPLYAKSQVNDVESTTWLWPLFSKTHGEGVDRFRALPFYSTSTLEGEFVKKSYLWPLVNTVEYTNDRNPGGGFIIVPVYGRVKTERADNYWLVAPFFRYMSSDNQWIVNAPWPFIQLADGEMHKRIFWPFYGKKRYGTLTKQYWLWPLLWNDTAEYPHYNRHRKRAVPFVHYHADVVTRPTPEFETGDVVSRYWKIWPLMSWERNLDRSRFRTLDLWPLRNTPGIERNWAPWWTLYRRMEVEGEIGHHLLWGLYRQTQDDEQFEWSLLKGLAGYKKNENNRRYRVLFMWFGGAKEQP
ncbi:hypothetical protein [Pontiella sp.]|uniref:hypothetical protein n=1 Tax=Pontiella sp. TaxID=2837462 RepID=UPI00356ADA27